MPKRRLALLLLAGCLGLGIAYARAHQAGSVHATHGMSTSAPEDLKWKPIRPGNEMAVVYGDPSKPGELYAVRFRFADGFKVPAHWHPQDEHATVLQGTLLLGMGEKWDAAELKTSLTTGSYIFLAREMRHFAQAKGETILQAHGVGPFVINYLDPSDDPRNQSRTASPGSE
ncbi:MAG: cupin domain-containing protein [Acidobacteriales bacterium]|nr:cupin domain-containing protein [Terriglobales bacterium]